MTAQTSHDPSPNNQARMLELVIQSLEQSLKERDLDALEGLFKQGAALTRRLLDGAEGPLHADWTQPRRS